MSLAVKDILKRPHFQQVEILAGTSGLDRKVNWVHIVEIETFGHLLNGNEAILTTGVGWANNETKSLFYLQQLLDNGVSALCIEFANRQYKLSEKMLALADRHEFPIIAFKKEVKFIDITKDLHQILLGYGEKTWRDLEKLYKKFNKILVGNSSISEFLKILYQGIGKQIALIHKETIRFFPSPSKREKEEWMRKIKESHEYYSYPVYLLNETIAHLYILEKVDKISDIDKLSAKRCSEFLSQYFWKYHQQKEIQKIKQNEWIIQAVRGRLSKETISKNIQLENEMISLNEAIIGVIPKGTGPLADEKNKSFLTGSHLVLRSVLEEYGFYLLAANDKAKNCYVLLLINQQDKNTLYKRLYQSLQQLKKSGSHRISDYIHWLSFGKAVHHYEEIKQSYEAALTTLNYQKKIGLLEKPFYANLGVYRLINLLGNRKDFQEIIEDYIGPLITYDREKGTDLLNTLQVYLKNLGVKNETANELFIVRQTLYHRLDRIEKLIGSDYLQPEKRLMIETAMYAYKYLHLPKPTKELEGEKNSNYPI